MNSETQPASQKQSPASKEFTVTMIIVVSASLIGASGGFLIANHADLVGQFRSLTRYLMRPSSGGGATSSKPSVKPDKASTNGKAAEARPATTKSPEAKPATTKSPEAPTTTAKSPASDLIGAISCSQQQDSTIVTVEVGSDTLVQAGRLNEPERIYFDLRESGRPEGAPQRLLKSKTIPVDGPLVAGIRVSLWDTGTARVVLDLKRACEYSYHLASEPSSRLIVDVQPSGLSETASKR